MTNCSTCIPSTFVIGACFVIRTSSFGFYNPRSNKDKPMNPLNTLQQRLREAFTDLYANFIDPLEPFTDDGERWLSLGGDSDALSSAGTLFGGPLTELSLSDIRNQCRLLAATNEFAINGHENRISFIIGPGHTYRATPRKCATG